MRTNRKVGLAGRHTPVLVASLAMLALGWTSAPTLGQSAAQVAAGRIVWDDASCAGCHGVNGQGGTSPDLPNGPSLRTDKLNRQELVEVISCGRAGKQMPAWLNGAYTKTPCYGAPVGQAPTDLAVVGAYDENQISALVDFIQATFEAK